MTREERSETTRSLSVLISGYVQLFLTYVNIPCNHIPCNHILCNHIPCNHIPSFANHIFILKGFFIFLCFLISDPKIKGIPVFWFSPDFFFEFRKKIDIPRLFFLYFFSSPRIFFFDFLSKNLKCNNFLATQTKIGWTLFWWTAFEWTERHSVLWRSARRSLV